MKILFANKKLEEQCTNLKSANKLFGGNKQLALSLLARINALRQATTIKDIIAQPPLHFHSLKNKNGNDLKGFYAIDVKSRRDAYRIILQPLDETLEPWDSSIDQIALKVKIVEIREISKHYE